MPTRFDGKVSVVTGGASGIGEEIVRRPPPVVNAQHHDEAWEGEGDVLLGMDEYPYHQITSTFAGVAGTDPAWNDGHYICLSDMVGEIGLASTLRL